MSIRTLYVKWLVWRGKAIDIWSKSPFPANVLSNFYPNTFVFEGVACGSMEGFLQSLKYKDQGEQKTICALSGKEAKQMTTNQWKQDQTVYWKGQAIHRNGEAFAQLLYKAYQALYEQNPTFRDALLSTQEKKLYHVQGNPNPHDTILTEKEFCGILTLLREKSQLTEKN